MDKGGAGGHSTQEPECFTELIFLSEENVIFFSLKKINVKSKKEQYVCLQGQGMHYAKKILVQL